MGEITEKPGPYKSTGLRGEPPLHEKIRTVLPRTRWNHTNVDHIDQEWPRRSLSRSWHCDSAADSMIIKHGTTCVRPGRILGSVWFSYLSTSPPCWDVSSNVKRMHHFYRPHVATQRRDASRATESALPPSPIVVKKSFDKLSQGEAKKPNNEILWEFNM